MADDRIREPMAATTNSSSQEGIFKFKLTPELNAGHSLSMTKDEEKIYEWSYFSEALTFAEWVATIFTVGIYYLITRVYIKRRRYYTLMITNSRFIFKEEMFERIGFCSAKRKILENQHSYMHSDLTFVTHEKTTTAGVLEMRFLKYPDWTDMSDDIYESRIAWFIRFIKHAFKTAFNATYDIDLDLPPLQRIIAIVSAADKLQSQYYATCFAIAFAKQLIVDMFNNMIEMIKAAFADPSIGSFQVLGNYDNTKFRFHCTTTEDASVHDKIKECMKYISAISFDKSREFLNASNFEKFSGVEVVTDGFQNVNGGQTAYRVHDSICPMTENEQVLDATKNNLRWTFSMIMHCISSLGVYYFEASGLLAHKASFVLTNKRLIRHNQLVSAVTGLDHYRVDSWIFPSKPNEHSSFTIMKDMDGNYDFFFDCGRGGGLLTLNLRNMDFLLRLAKHMTTTVEIHPPMTAFSTYEEDLVHCKRTSAVLGPREKVEVALSAQIPQQSFYNRFLKCASERDCLVLTNQGIYIEGHSKECYSKKKTSVSFLPYSVLQGVYWSNFDSHDIAGCSCCMPKDCCRVMYDEVHGYNGVRVYISVKGIAGLKFGARFPSRYYGVSDMPVDTLVNSLNYAMLERVHKDIKIFTK